MRRVPLVLLVLGSLVAAGCSGGDDDPPGGPLTLTEIVVGEGGASLTVSWTGGDGGLVDLTIDDPSTEQLDFGRPMEPDTATDGRSMVRQEVPLDLVGASVLVGVAPLAQLPERRSTVSLRTDRVTVVGFDAEQATLAWPGVDGSPRHEIWTRAPGQDWVRADPAQHDGTEATIANPVPDGAWQVGLVGVQSAGDDGGVIIRTEMVVTDVGWDPRTVAMGAGAATPRAPVPDEGEVLHVAPGGDDSAAGTESDPLRTIAHAVALAGDGATVVVHEGLYRESAGDVFRPVHIMAAPGEQVIVSGADPVTTPWTAAGDGTWSTPFVSPLPQPGDADYLIVEDQIDPDRPVAGALEQLFVDGEPIVQVASTADLANEPDGFVYDAAAGRLVLGRDPSGRAVEVTTRALGLKFHPGNGDAPGADGSSVTGLTFTAFGPFHQDGYAALVVDAADVALTDVAVTRSSAAGLAVYAPGATLTRVTASVNGARGLTADTADGLTVAFGRFDGNNTEGFDYADCGGGVHCVVAGIKVTHTQGVTVAHSSIGDNLGTGLWCDLACVDATIVGNVVTGNAKHGIFYEVSRDALIAGNVVAGHDGPGSVAVRLVGSDDVTVTRNTFAGNATDLEVSDDPRAPGDLADDGIDTDPSGVVVTGNLFSESPELVARLGDRAVLETGDPSSAGPPSSRFERFDDNAYLLASDDEGATPFRFRWLADDGSVAYRSTLAGFQAVSGLDAGAEVLVLQRSLFIDGGLLDLRLAGDPFDGASVDPPDLDAIPGAPASAPPPGVGAWYVAG